MKIAKIMPKIAVPKKAALVAPLFALTLSTSAISKPLETDSFSKNNTENVNCLPQHYTNQNDMTLQDEQSSTPESLFLKTLILCGVVCGAVLLKDYVNNNKY